MKKGNSQKETSEKHCTEKEELKMLILEMNHLKLGKSKKEKTDK